MFNPAQKAAIFEALKKKQAGGQAQTTSPMAGALAAPKAPAPLGAAPTSNPMLPKAPTAEVAPAGTSFPKMRSMFGKKGP